MKELFKMDNPVMRFLGRMTDFMLINLLFLVFSIPIVTIGASMTAAHKVMQDKVYQDDRPIIKRFWKAFIGNFKQATLSWLVIMVILGAMIYNAILIPAYFGSTSTATTFYLALALISLPILAVISYLFPMIARYDNTVRRHIYNALYMAIWKLPRTLLIVILFLLPVALIYFFTLAFFQYIYVWLFFLFAVCFYLMNLLMKPVFDYFEQLNDGMIAKEDEAEETEEETSISE